MCEASVLHTKRFVVIVEHISPLRSNRTHYFISNRNKTKNASIAERKEKIGSEESIRREMSKYSARYSDETIPASSNPNRVPYEIRDTLYIVRRSQQTELQRGSTYSRIEIVAHATQCFDNITRWEDDATRQRQPLFASFDWLRRPNRMPAYIVRRDKNTKIKMCKRR